MTDARDHALVRAETNAAERHGREDLAEAVASELGVPAAALEAYRQVARAIDRYARGTQADTATAGRDPRSRQGELTAEVRRAVGTIVEAAVDLYRRSPTQISRRPDEVTAQSRRILTAALTLRDELGVQVEPLATRRATVRDDRRRSADRDRGLDPSPGR